MTSRSILGSSTSVKPKANAPVPASSMLNSILNTRATVSAPSKEHTDRSDVSLEKSFLTLDVQRAKSPAKTTSPRLVEDRILDVPKKEEEKKPELPKKEEEKVDHSSVSVELTSNISSSSTTSDDDEKRSNLLKKSDSTSSLHSLSKEDSVKDENKIQTEEYEKEEGESEDENEETKSEESQSISDSISDSKVRQRKHHSHTFDDSGSDSTSSFGSRRSSNKSSEEDSSNSDSDTDVKSDNPVEFKRPAKKYPNKECCLKYGLGTCLFGSTAAGSIYYGSKHPENLITKGGNKVAGSISQFLQSVKEAFPKK